MAFEGIRPTRLDTSGFDNALSGFFGALKQRGIDDATAELSGLVQQGAGRNALMGWAQRNPSHPSARQFTNALASNAINPPKADPMRDLNIRLKEAQLKEAEARAARASSAPRGRLVQIDGKVIEIMPDGNAREVYSSGPPKADPMSAIKGAPQGYAWADPTNPNAGVRPLPGFEKPIPGDVAGKVALMNQARTSIEKSRNVFERPWGAGDVAKYGAANIPLVGDVGMLSGDVGMALRDIRTGVEAALRTMTGAAAPEQEVQRYMEMFSPRPTDTPQVVRQKLDGLTKFMADAERLVVQGRGVDPTMIPATPQAAPQAPAPQGGMAMPRSKQEYDALPPGTPYTAPDGSVRVKP